MTLSRKYVSVLLVWFALGGARDEAVGQDAVQPAASWRFDEGAGQAADDASGNGNKGEIHGAAWAKEKEGNALLFDGDDDCVSCTEQQHSLSPESALTIEAWVRPMGVKDYAFLVDHGKGWGDNNQGYRLLLYNGAIRFMLATSEKVYNVVSAINLQIGQWYHIAVTYDGKQIKIYLNGVLDREEAAAGKIGYAGIKHFTIGVGDGSRCFCGEIDEVKIFGVALTPEQVAGDYRRSSSRILTPEELTRYLASRLERFKLDGVPQKPWVRDRRTALLANFDNAKINDADYARYRAVASGGPTDSAAAGKFGLGVRTFTDKTPVIYPGASNCCLDKGTAEFWIRSPEGENIWADAKDYYLLTLFSEHGTGFPNRPGWSLVLRKTGATKALELVAHTGHIYWYAHINAGTLCATANARLLMPAASLSPTEWHHVAVSWDRTDGGRIWLAVDGEGVTTAIHPPLSAGVLRPCKKIYLGGAYFADFTPTANAVFDDFRITDVSIPERTRAVKLDVGDDPLMKADDLCRAWFDFAATLRVGGGWQCLFEWPGLSPTECPGTYSVLTEDEYTARYTMPSYLRAYEVLRDERYLRLAEFAGQLLIKAQDENGAWCQGYIVMPDGLFPVAPGGASIEEGTQTDPIRFLAYLHRVTGKDEYRKAAVKGGELVLAAQNPDGSWPLYFNSKTMKRPEGSYGGCSTLNDGTTNWGMKTMLMVYHVTKDEKYLSSLRKAGDWLVRVQAGPPTFGWAEQYTPDGQPAWARDFEPPATCITAIDYATDALFLMYDLTGEEEYLDALRKCLDWAKSVPEEKKGWRYYDTRTGEPVVAANRRAYVVGSPEYEELMKSDTRVWYPKGGSPAARIQGGLTARRQGPLVPAWRGSVPRRGFVKGAPTASELTAALAQRAAGARGALQKLEHWRAGEVENGGIISWISRCGPVLNLGTGCDNACRALDLLGMVQAAAGEAPPESVPLYQDIYFGYVDPTCDWFDTPLMKNSGEPLTAILRTDGVKLFAEQSEPIEVDLSNRTAKPISGALSVAKAPPFVAITPDKQNFTVQAGGTTMAAFRVQGRGQAGRGEIGLSITSGDKAREMAVPVESVAAGAGFGGEAEGASEIVAPMVVAADDTASGGKCVVRPRDEHFENKPEPADGQSGGFVTLKFDLTQPGEYALWARTWWADTGGNSLYVSVDGGPETTFGNDDVFLRWCWREGEKYKLNAGPHVIKVRNRETGSRLDRLFLCPW